MMYLPAVREAVSKCFASDQDLIARFHIASGSGLKACIEKTMSDVAKFDPTFRFYTLYDRGEIVAYWGTEYGNCINLIFVKPEYRTRHFMAKFWKKIQDSVGNPFYAAVYSKNTPAIEFYLARGGEPDAFQYDGHSITAFTFKKAVK